MLEKTQWGGGGGCRGKRFSSPIPPLLLPPFYTQAGIRLKAGSG